MIEIDHPVHSQPDTIEPLKIAYSCVVDRDPDFFFQALYWFSSLINLAGVDPKHLFLHFVRGTDPFCADVFEKLGAQTVWIDPFSAAHATCNKIKQAESSLFEDYDYVALCDCDIAISEPFTSDIAQHRLLAKPVDFANPPLDILQNILAKSGINASPPVIAASLTTDGSGISRLTTTAAAKAHSSATLANNCNGGVYVIKQSLLHQLGIEWKHWADWLTVNIELLQSHSFFIDQVAFALATWALRLDVTPLPITQNFPIHVQLDPAIALLEPPKALHFHRTFDATGTIKASGVPLVDEIINHVNTAHRSLLASLASSPDTTLKLVSLKHARWRDWCNTVSKRPLHLPNHMDHEKPLIAIETVGQCQYECPYCPVSNHPKRKGRLEIGAITKLLEELTEYDGTIQLRFHFYNEPTLDVRLPDIIAHARRSLPNTYMRLVTNGELLDEELIHEIFSAGIDQIAVSCHRPEVFERLTHLLECLIPKPNIELRPSFRTTTWSNRLSSVNLSAHNLARSIPAGARPWGCSFLTSQIDYQGNVHMCCEDFRGNLIEGSILQDSLFAIRQRAKSRTKETYCGFLTGPCRSCAGLNDEAQVELLVSEEIARRSAPS